VSKKNPSLLIRADADSQMGTGHVMRCLALAQAWRDRFGDVTFLGRFTDALKQRIESEGMRALYLDAEPGSLQDAKESVQVAAQLGTSHVVLDGYHFTTKSQQIIKDAGNKLLVVDDFNHAGENVADVLVNQNERATPEMYDCPKQTQLLLGFKWAMLRREFADKPQRTYAERAQRILLTLGGADPNGITVSLVRALAEINGDWQAAVVVGGANPKASDVEAACEATNGRARFLSNVTDLGTLMRWAEVAVSAAGVTALELAAMGVPAVLLTIANNQRDNALALQSAGTAVSLGENADPSEVMKSLASIMTSADTRERMSRAGMRLFDGRGADRVAEVFAAL
jgi:UDP-2,4-diacetamido-2,4,6-trideoxy-beta-L-altropyranose hydrolase